MTAVRTLFSALLVAALAAPASTQASTKVVPEVYTNFEGSSASTYPLSYTQCHWQYLLDAPALCKKNAVITAFEFRLGGSTSTSSTVAKTLKPKIDFYTTTLKTGAMSKTWASNIGAAKPTTVFNGTLKVPGGTLQYPYPQPFTATIKLAKPFVFDATKGNLLIDWTEAQGYVYSRWFADGIMFYRTANSRRGYIYYDKSCADSLNRSARLSISGTTGVVGTSLDISYTLNGSGLNLMLNWIGGSNRLFGPFKLPIPLTGLGLPGCKLATDILITQAATSSPVRWPLPNDPKLAGIVLFSQGLALDSSTGKGVTTYNAYQIELASANGITNGPAQSVYRAKDNTATSGYMSPSGFYAPVIRFVGIIN